MNLPFSAPIDIKASLYNYVIVYCKVIVLLIWPLIFIVGIAQTRANSLSWPLADYSYLNARGDHDIGSIRPRLTHCMTGLGPSGRYGNRVLGGWYFNSIQVPNDYCPYIIQPHPGSAIAGVINMHQCRQFSTAVEGVYTCIIRNSSMMYQSIRLGIYYSRRSK